jgi:hypothetical protein
MTDVCMFKRGADLKGEMRTDDDDTVTCVDCGAREPDQTAYEAGWQLVPPAQSKAWRRCDEQSSAGRRRHG